VSVVKSPARCEPSPAERVRSILAASGSLGVTTAGAREEIMAGAAAEFGDGIRLRVPADCHVVGEMLCASPTPVPAVLEWTDLAPVPVRDRVRARVRLAVRMTDLEPGPGDTVRLHLDVRRSQLTAGGREPAEVDRRSLLAARPDPVATCEARLLLHLAEGHRAHVEALARLLEDRHLMGVTRVTPLALDRYGIVLRLEYHRRQCDVRLPFPRPLSDPDELGHRIHALLAHPQGRPQARPYGHPHPDRHGRPA
jgi:hypothetical protein